MSACSGLEWALSAAFLVPLVSSWSDRVRRERLLTATLIPRALLLGAAGAAMSGHGQAMLVAVLVALDGGLCSVFRPVQAALLPWLARTPGELTSANTAASVMQAAAMLVGPAIAAGLLRPARRGPPCSSPAGSSRPRPCCSPVSGRSRHRCRPGRPRSSKQVRLDIAAGFTACIRQGGALALVVPAAVQNVRRRCACHRAPRRRHCPGSVRPRPGRASACWAQRSAPAASLAHRLPSCWSAGRGSHAAVAAGGRGLGSAYDPARFHARGILAVPALRRHGVANLVDDVAVYSALQRVIPPRLMGRALGARRAVLLL